MKKITLVMSVIIMAALLAFSAAAEAQVFEADTTDNSFDITYTEATPGQYYAIVIVNGIVEVGSTPTITAETIQYIDQKTAGANGTVSFEDVLLYQDGTEATVFLGGSDLPGAVVLGWVNKAEEANTFTFSGNVTSGTSKPATVTLTDIANAENTYTAETVEGVYTITGVTGATYKVYITAPGQLSYTKNALEISEDTAFKDVTIKSGDVDRNDEVNTFDLGDLIKKFNSADEFSDINGDGEVNTFDLGDLIKNFNAESVVED